MKLIFKPMILTMMFMALLLSCNNEELFVEEPITEVVDDTENDDVEDTTDDTENEDVDTDTSLPCDFDLGDVAAGETVIINCVMDLGGATINLPSDVTLLYEGGEIINGTLNFSNNTTLDGNLLNMTLTTTGSNPVMKDPVFEFVPERWGIVEGVVSDEVARNNRDILEEMMFNAKSFGIETFKIDQLDAYFKVDSENPHNYPEDDAINVPSDFILSMTDNTHLRMQPNNYTRPTLLAVWKVTNVIVEGGNLHGDRDKHDYSEGGTHEWGHCLRIGGSNEVIVKNMNIYDATGDGIDVHAFGHAFGANYIPSQNILISNNKIYRARRNGISVTDGRDILIEGNDFIDTSIHTGKSNGVAPGYGIDVEAVRINGEIYEIAEDITIRNNIEKGSRVGAFTVHTGDRVTIEGNQTESKISYSTSIGTIIRNNTLIAVKDTYNATNVTAIVAGRGDRYEANYGGRVYGNTIIGFAGGVIGTNTDLEIYDNEIINCKKGIELANITNSKVYNNVIQSEVSDSDGVLNAAASKYIKDVLIAGNNVEVLRTPFKFMNQNIEQEQENYIFAINSNIISSSNTCTISNVNGFMFSENTILKGGIRFEKAMNGEIYKNSISSIVRIDSGCSNLNFYDNELFGNCIRENNTDAIEVVFSNNICN